MTGPTAGGLGHAIVSTEGLPDGAEVESTATPIVLDAVVLLLDLTSTVAEALAAVQAALEFGTGYPAKASSLRGHE